MGRYLTPLAVVLVVAAVIIIVTSGDSLAVRYLSDWYRWMSPPGSYSGSADARARVPEQVRTRLAASAG
jgi:hypothetical protein